MFSDTPRGVEKKITEERKIVNEENLTEKKVRRKKRG